MKNISFTLLDCEGNAHMKEVPGVLGQVNCPSFQKTLRVTFRQSTFPARTSVPDGFRSGPCPDV